MLLVTVVVSGSQMKQFPPFYIYKVSPNQSFTCYWFKDLAGNKITSDDRKLRLFITGNWRLRHDVKKWAVYLKTKYANLIEVYWVFNPASTRLVDHYERTKKLLKGFELPIGTIIDSHSFVGRALKINYNTTTIIGLNMNKLAFVFDSPLNKQSAKAVSTMIKHKLIQDNAF